MFFSINLTFYSTAKMMQGVWPTARPLHVTSLIY